MHVCMMYVCKVNIMYVFNVILCYVRMYVCMYVYVCMHVCNVCM